MARSARVVAAPAHAPGPYWYVVAVVIVLVGWGAMEATIALRTRSTVDRMIRAIVPGQVELRLEEPGTYTIFHEYHSAVDGRAFVVEGVSGLIVNVRSGAGADPLALQGAVGLSYDSGGKAGRSLFQFEVGTSGAFQLSASFSDGRREPQTVLAVAHDYVKDRATTRLMAEAFAFGAIALAAITALTVYRRRRLAASAAQYR